jgi:Flp pilus assembly secretin CpaC|tara:strand:- start:271 stop:621 length:351 start_codon:yes stop_codon:yes gene_type:complete
MSVHSLTVKNILSRIRQVFPDAQENYVINLINDALVEMGYYSNKISHAKISAVANQMWYDLSDGAEDSSGNKLELNKVKRVYLMDNEGDYIQIPRLTDTNLLLTDITSESALEAPD